MKTNVLEAPNQVDTILAETFVNAGNKGPKT